MEGLTGPGGEDCHDRYPDRSRATGGGEKYLYLYPVGGTRNPGTGSSGREGNPEGLGGGNPMAETAWSGGYPGYSAAEPSRLPFGTSPPWVKGSTRVA